jgi:hypothetical protein
MNEYLFQGLTFSAAGLFFLWWAKPLSLQYNAWTTGLRERHPNINPPPTPEWRERNTKIMTVIFRLLGVFFLLLSTVPFLAFVGSVVKPH